MREYGKVSPKFWIGTTGQELRGDNLAQLIALYLITSSHGNMTGVFHCPKIYIAHEVGCPIEGASKALLKLCKVSFCEYEESSETVFVIRMAAFQIAESLAPTDKRVSWLKKEVEKMTSARLKQRFLETYGRAFHIVPLNWSPSPFEGASKPHRSHEHEHEQEHEHDHEHEIDHEHDLEHERFLKGSGETLLEKTNSNGHEPTNEQQWNEERQRIEKISTAMPNASRNDIARIAKVTVEKVVAHFNQQKRERKQQRASH